MNMNPELNAKHIAILIPSYLGGGAEKVTNIIFGELVKKYCYSVQIICVQTNEMAIRTGEEVGFNVTPVNIGDSEITGENAGLIMLDALKASTALNIVYAGFIPFNPKLYRDELRGRNLIFHLHTMPSWQAVSKIVGTREYLNVIAQIRREVKWYFGKYLREKWFKVFARRYSKYYQSIYDNSNHFVVLAEAYRQQMNRYLGFRANDNKSKVTVVYNPATLTELLPLAEIPKQKEVLFAGRLNCTEKGVDSLLRAWERLFRHYPEWKLKIVGDGPDRGYLEYMARILGLKNYTFLPYTTNLAEHLSTASILCLPSNIEGWGLVLIEAMAAGVVPIAFKCSGGVEEILSEGRGIGVQPGNVRLLAAGIASLMNSPDDIDMRRKLYPDYVKRFDTYSAVNSYLKLLQ